ncbi:putative gas vesicle synthesis protein GvpO [Gordonia namibiensis NBRC 108229]|uniref:Putative gas vesicle synthesis protein GvpO n=1 Tax=Gordonia namibiensis NBRC 108229 TaxID=1208314 RepID=K6XAV3_9ACTN|nr:gas vesicle protein GvpO [Gordonia namibiensis]GAC01523.1 putative gas vesicle synthesis protein GvpO [Gordonia namibiensis NBRC 108229]
MAQEEPESLSAQEIAALALRAVADLTGKEPLGATSVMPTEEGWRVEVEVIEDRRIPSSTDILALYAVDLDLDGQLFSYRRTRRYSRGAGDNAAAMGEP